MRQVNTNPTRETYTSYLQSLVDELKFLWQDAQAAIDKGIKERKLAQYWQMYRFYRQQKEHYTLLFQ